MNELFIVNPGKPRRKRARRKAHASMTRNPAPKKRRRAKRARSHFTRNPGMPRIAGLDLGAIGYGVAGAIGTELGGAAVAKFLPANMQSTPVKLATKAALVVIGSMLVRRFVGSQAAKALALGGGIAVGVEAAREWILPNIPGLSDMMADYLVPGDASISGYLPEGLSGVGSHPLDPSTEQFSAQWG